MGGWGKDSKEDYSRVKTCQRSCVRRRAPRLFLSTVGFVLLCVALCRGAPRMFWWLSAYWQAPDDSANRRSNHGASLFILGIKLKNTASNFIPGFPDPLFTLWHLLTSMMPFLSPAPWLPSLAGKQTRRDGSRKKMDARFIMNGYILADGINGRVEGSSSPSPTRCRAAKDK